MTRTQIYLTEEQHQQASRVAAESGQTLSDVIRQALDEHLLRRRRQRKEFLSALEQASGVWRNRDDVPDLAEARKKSERFATWPPEH